MNKKIILLSLLASVVSYASDSEFYQESESGVKLENSVISTTGFETSQRNIPSNVTVITSKEIESKNYKSVSEALKDVPSVNLIGDPKNPIVDMRGQGSKATSNVQVLIDGVAINLLDTSHANTPINTVPIENIEKIEVIPGGGAILYGSGTRGGIINIITKSGSGYNGGFVSSDIDSFGAKSSSVNYGTTVGKLGLNLNYNKNDYKGFRDGDEADSDYFEGSAKYQISKTKDITFKYSKFKEDSTSPRGLTKSELGDRDSNGLYGKYDELATKDTDKDEFTVKYQDRINDKLTFDMISFYQITDIKSTNNYDSSGYKILNNMDYKDKKIGVKPKIKIDYSENSNLILGYDYIYNNLTRDSEMTIFSKEVYKNDLTKETHSLFALNTNKIGKFEFTQGVRYEYADYEVDRTYTKGKTSTDIQNDKTMENAAYELVGNYFYSDKGNVYLKGVKGFTSPAPAQLVDKINGSYVDNDLDSETYTTYELGIKDYVLGSFVSGAVYYTETKDEIATENYSNMNFRNYNIGKTKRYGLELTAEQYFGKLTVREGYSLVKTEILEDQDKSIEGNEIANVPSNRFNVALDYQLTPKVNLIWDTVYSSGYYLNNENTQGKQNENVVTNVFVNYQVKENLKLYTGINNIFNEKYYNSIDSKGKEYDPAAERSFKAGFKYNF